MESAKPKVVAIIQARMASSRLPGKVLLPLGPDNKSVLWWMATRAGLAELVDQVVIATTDNPKNQPIMVFADQNHKGLYAYAYNGEENDVIGRVLSAAKHYDADIICDITSDCPLIDFRHIDKMINILLNSKFDYVSNCVYRDWFDGVDVQIYWADALMKCKRLLSPFKHVGWNIAQHPNIFDIYHYIAPEEMHLPHWGLTLDEINDYELLKIIFNEFGADPGFDIGYVVKYLKKNPELLRINKNVKRKDPKKEK